MTVFKLQFISQLLIVVTQFLTISDGVEFANFPCKNDQTRNFVQFGSLICNTLGNPLGYNGYGCWCGKGNRGNLVVDATDFCCKVHDKCWDSLEQNVAGCSPFTRWYSYTRRSDNDVQCNDPVGTCDHGTCLCDKAAVNCFARHRSTSYDSDFDNWQGLCTETSKTPNMDPDRCPSVWNNSAKYSPGSLVSVHGNKYQSLYQAGPGGNPAENSFTSNSLGVQATWKKLGPCRRTNDAPPSRAPTIDILSNSKWTPEGLTVAGRYGYGTSVRELFDPIGLYVDDDQTVYVAEIGNNRIVAWKQGATSGAVVAGGNGPGAGPHQLYQPYDVIVDKQRDSLIICDGMNRRVVRWPRQNGNNGEIILSNIFCWGLAMDDSGSLYVVDTKNHVVRRYRMGDTEGTVVAGNNERGEELNQLSDPRYIFVDRNHSVYVTDLWNSRVMKWEEGAKEGIVVAGSQGMGYYLTQLYRPQGVAVDERGTVYVADAANNRIVRWPHGATEGNIILGGYGELRVDLREPSGLSFDRQGNLYVVDRNNHRVQKFNIQDTTNE